MAVRRRREETMEERFIHGAPVQPEAERRERPFLRMVGLGLARLAGLIAAAAAITAGAGLLIGWLRGDDLWTAVTYAFYIGGVALVGFAMLTGGRQVQWRGELGEGLGPGGGTISQSAVIVFIGIVLLLLGVLVESQT
jgi:hypothetical protein